MNKDDGGAAFPQGFNADPYDGGMSLRDYLATQVMAGRLAFGGAPPEDNLQRWAIRNYGIADAMLKARQDD